MANLRTNNLSGEQGQNAYRGSVFFHGGGQLDVTSNSDFAVGTGAYTAEVWFHSGLNSGENSIFGTFTASNFGFGMWHNENNLYFEERQNAFSGDNPRIIYDTFEEGYWYHLAMCRDSSSGTLRAYVNGVQIGSTTSNLRTIAGTAPTIGKNAAASNQCNGYISNIRFSNTELYPSGTTFTPPTSELTADASTILLACQNSDDPTQEETGKTLTNSSLLSDQPKVIPPFGVDAGNTFGGPIQQSSQGYMYFPTGRTEERGGSRGILAGGHVPSEVSTIDFFNVQSTGNSLTFGNLTDTFGYVSSYASHTRAVHSVNYNAPAVLNTLEFITIATQGNAVDFGDRTVVVYENGALSNETRGLVGGGYDGSGSGTPNNTETIDFNTIASLGNSTDFGDLTLGRRGLCGLASPTRGVFAAGYQQPDTSTKTNVIDFVTIASAGNASNFGDLVTARWGVSPASSATRGIFAGGATPSEVDSIEFITIASTGDTTDFGDLTQNSGRGNGTSDKIRGVFKIGYTPSTGQNTQEFVTIATTGNAKDFGDSVSKTHSAGMTSNAHGGLS